MTPDEWTLIGRLSNAREQSRPLIALAKVALDIVEHDIPTDQWFDALNEAVAMVERTFPKLVDMDWIDA